MKIPITGTHYLSVWRLGVVAGVYSVVWFAICQAIHPDMLAKLLWMGLGVAVGYAAGPWVWRENTEPVR